LEHLKTSKAAAANLLKGTVSRDFLLLVFFINQFPPQPQSIPLAPYHFEFFFLKNSRRYLQVKVHHRYQRQRINDTGGKIATGNNDTGGKFASGVSNTAANFATSLASVVDTGGKQICHQCQ
jgi:hypothetical protein